MPKNTTNGDPENNAPNTIGGWIAPKKTEPKKGNIETLFDGAFKAAKKAQPTIRNPFEAQTDFIDFMHALGFEIDSIIPDGKIHRIKAPDDRSGEKSGWYIYHDDAQRPVAIAGDWRSDDQHKFVFDTGSTPTPAEIEAANRRAEQAKQIRREELETQHMQAAERAGQHVAGLNKAPGDHAYLITKNIEPHGALVDVTGKLVIPAWNASGEITTYQTIDETGQKRFMPNGKKAGSFFAFGNINNDARVFVCEGFATGASIHQATGDPVVCAFDCGNLSSVAHAVLEIAPACRLVIAADNDHSKEKNAGLDEGRRLSQALNCDLVYPVFDDPQNSDFNDLHRSAGLEAVRRAIEPERFEAMEQDSDEPEIENSFTPHSARLASIDGVLGDFVDWINRNAPKPQPLFAVQTALALGALAMGRRYITTNQNHSHSWFINVGETGCGKEFANAALSAVIYGAGHGDMLMKSGYTSPTAIHNALEMAPTHLMVMDEFGRTLSSMKAGRNSHESMAYTELMQLYGVTGIHKGKQFATDKRLRGGDKPEPFAIAAPSVSFLGMSTPGALYDALTVENIHDGLLNRFLLVDSDTNDQTSIWRQEISDPPDSVIDWFQQCRESLGNLPELLVPAPAAIKVNFTQPARRLFERMAIDVVQRKKDSGKDYENIYMRSVEKAMRVALVVAGSINNQAPVIDETAAAWAIEYVLRSDDTLRNAAIKHVTAGEYAKTVDQCFDYIRESGIDGRTKSQINRKAPMRNMDSREVQGLLIKLESMGKIVQHKITQTRGQPMTRYYAATVTESEAQEASQ